MADSDISYRTDFGLGMWWPNYDHKPEKCYAFVQHGLKDMDVAIKAAKSHQVCIQAGGHAGCWPAKLATAFRTVITFEPEPVLYKCMVLNLAEFWNVTMLNVALSDHEGTVKMRPHPSAGSWRVDDTGTVPVRATTIDTIYAEKHLRYCDAIFLDVEGYEVEALRGGMKVINAFHPVLHVEELPRARDAIRAHMQAIGYREHAKAGRDVVYVPR